MFTLELCSGGSKNGTKSDFDLSEFDEEEASEQLLEEDKNQELEDSMIEHSDSAVGSGEWD